MFGPVVAWERSGTLGTLTNHKHCIWQKSDGSKGEANMYN